MAEKTINCLDKVKAYPGVDVDKGLWFMENYKLNSWFYIGRGDLNGDEMVFLYHAILFQYPGIASILVSSLTFTNRTTGEHYMDSQVYTKEDAEFATDKFYVKCPNAELYGDLGEMYVKANAPFGSIDIKVVPVGTPLYNSCTGCYHMFDIDPDLYAMDIHQYALPTMETTGKVTVNGKEYEFTGNTWLDRQWQIDFTLSESEQEGGMDLTKIPTWGWFSVSLENGETLSVWFPKNNKGEWNSWCTVLHPNGVHTLTYVENIFKTGENWYHNEDSPFTYPTKYTIRIPEYDAELVITSDMPDQEVRNDEIGSFDYYEGACTAEGIWMGKPIKGFAFLEMIGVWMEGMI